MTRIATKPHFYSNGHLTSLYELIIDNDDQENAEKVLDLSEKLTKNELVVAFSGHFSAGKSSMINALFEQDILPNSPIPTSANIVKIVSGGDTARIFFYNDLPIEYKEPYDFDMIKQYCQDKDTIKRIELNINESILPNGCAIIDTPGIDAANDGDRIMTESSLHLADFMFYVMDYNHVQSEINLNFLKSLQKKQIPIVIIINQIDKHNEAELTFQAFKDSFKETLDLWEIKPSAVFYSSLKANDHIHNEFPEIKKYLNSVLTTNKESIINIDHSLQQVIHDHKDFLEEYVNVNIANGPDEKDNNISLIDIETIQSKLAYIEQQSRNLNDEFQSEVNNTLRNAYLMPASIREQAKLFLESQQRDFKIGLFTSKRKIETVKSNRVNDFLKLLQPNIEASIEWQLRNKFTRLLKKYSISDNNLLLSIQRLNIDYTVQDLIALVNKGATINGSYILNYTNQVSENIKGKYKKKVKALLNETNIIYNKQMEASINEYTSKLGVLKTKYKLQLKQRQLRQMLEDSYNQIDYALKKPTSTVEAASLLEEAIEKRSERINKIKVLKARPNKLKENIFPEKLDIAVPEETVSTNTVESTLSHVGETIEIIESLPGFQSMIDDLYDKQQRLQSRTLTISLFGAFSAGKSSFANALMGDNILPVSPNPTTATITRISPVTKKNKHGTVVIQLKNEQELVNDILEITKEFSPVETRLTELLEWIQTEKIHQDNRLNKTYQSYLYAIIAGFDYSKDKIGRKTTIKLTEFASYVTDEEKACYIESVDLYYQCSVTDQGITIVDTPGADSINARHTSVAFDYIKNTDAILYVTYYNHALSRADKDFLMQLGRVKDSFELDKMFFIINAADLAKDNEELQLVENYVKDELLKLNIRLPRVYSVSSKQSLNDKLQNDRLNNPMESFESSFYEFIHNDLASLMVQSTNLDIKRSYEAVNNYVNTIDLNEVEIESYRTKLVDFKIKKLQLVKNINYIIYEERISQRIDTQLYYVKQRLSIRFNDLFKDTFNPTTISGTGKHAQEKLVRSLNHLLDDTSYELLQELRAVSLRIEAMMWQLMNEFYERIQSKVNDIDDAFTLPTINDYDFDTPQFDQAFTMIEHRLFDWALKQFKGTKSFFVNKERDTMKENIYTILVPFIKQYIKTNNNKMEQQYVSQWNEAMALVWKQLQASVQMNFKQNMLMTTNKVNKYEIIEKQQKLKQIVQAVHIKDDKNEEKYITS